MLFRSATLKTLKQEMPVEWMRALAKDGPTTASRRQAVQFLRGNATPDTVAVLEAIANNPAQRRSLRNECISAIADFQSEAGRAAIARFMEKPPEMPRVRAAVCSAVAQLGDKPKAIAWLAKTLQGEKSYAVRNACKIGRAHV